MEIGRNDPCPCGSGKKYKKCCLGKDGIVMVKINKEDPGASFGYAVTWILSNPELSNEFDKVVKKHTKGKKPTDVEIRNLADAFIFDYKLQEGITPFEYFLENAKLSSNDHSIFKRLFKENVFSVFEVLEVYRNEGLKVKDITWNKEYRVKELRGTHQLMRGYTVICRIAPFMSDFVITTPAPRFVPRDALRAPGRITAFDLASAGKKLDDEFNGGTGKYKDKSIDEIIKLFRKKLNAPGIKLNSRTLDRRINESESPVEAFPEVFKVTYRSDEDFEEMQEIIFGLWNKYPRKEFNGKSAYEYEADLMGPAEREILHDLMKKTQENINPDDYDSVEEAQNAANKFRDKWIKKPQKELNGKTPERVILEERESLGNPYREIDIKIGLSKIPDPNEGRAEKLYHEGVGKFKEREFGKAIECFREVIDMYPENYKALGNLGACFTCIGKKTKAIECYKKAISINPEYEFAKKNLELTEEKSPEELENMSMPRMSFRDVLKKIVNNLRVKQ